MDPKRNRFAKKKTKNVQDLGFDPFAINPESIDR